MEVTYVAPIDLATKGGNIQHVLGICKHAHKENVNIHLLCLNSAQEVLGDFPFRVSTFNCSGMSAFERLVRFSKFAQAIIKEKKPDAVYLRPFPLDYLLITRFLYRVSIPYFYEINTIWKKELRSQRKFFKAILYPFFEKLSMARAAGVFPVTEEIKEYCALQLKSNTPMYVGGNGIEIPPSPTASKFDLRKKWGLPQDKKIAVMAGFTRPWHGHERLLASIPYTNDEVHFCLVGSDNEEITKRIQNNAKISRRITVLPWITHEETTEIIFASDIGIAPLAFDKIGLQIAQSLKVRHYLGLGKPVLIHTRESHSIEQSGFIFRVSTTSPQEIAKTLLYALQESSHFTPEAVTNYAQKNLTWESISRKTFQFLKQAV